MNYSTEWTEEQRRRYPEFKRAIRRLQIATQSKQVKHTAREYFHTLRNFDEHSVMDTLDCLCVSWDRFPTLCELFELEVANRKANTCTCPDGLLAGKCPMHGFLVK